MLVENELIILSIFIIFCLLEIILFLWVSFVRKRFQWLITSKDENPLFSKEGLDKFIPEGFDSEIRWIRKPNTKREEKGKFG